MGLAAFCAGLVDSIAGGGGLIIVPLLLLGGLDPVATLATNKLQSSFGSFSATLSFARAGHMDLKKYAPLALASGFASFCGAFLVTRFSTNWLLALMPVLLILIALYFGFSRSIKDRPSKARITPLIFGLSFVPLIGFYDGFFGPGAGSFFVLGVVTLLGLAAIPATGLTKYLNFASNFGGLLFFIWLGKVSWILGLTMGTAQFAGAQLGSRLAMRSGAKLIRPLLVFISIAMAIRLLLNPQNPLRQNLVAFFGF